MPQILVPIVVPAIAGGLCLLLPRRVKFVREAISLVALAWSFVVALQLFQIRELAYTVDWMVLGDLSIKFDLLLGHFSSFVTLFVTLFGLAIGLYSVGEFPWHFQHDEVVVLGLQKLQA